MRMASHDLHERQLLASIETGRPVSQRALSRELGIALGLTNLLLRKMAEKGWIKLLRVPPNRFLYYITPDGIAEKTRKSQAYFSRNIQFYRETRDRISESMATLSRLWPAETNNGSEGGQKRVVFFGAGEVAEIGFICLQATDLTLVGVVDAERRAPFFGLPVTPPSGLRGMRLNGLAFDRLIVMLFDDGESVRQEVAACGLPEEAIVWL